MDSSKSHPSYWVSAATPDRNPGVKSMGPGGGGPGFDDPLIGASVLLCTLRMCGGQGSWPQAGPGDACKE